MKDLKQIKSILAANKQFLNQMYSVKEIGIFGSFVRGEQTRRSDVDILVEFGDVPDLIKFIELERRLQRMLGKKVDLIRKQAIREELKNNILKEVVIV